MAIKAKNKKEELNNKEGIVTKKDKSRENKTLGKILGVVAIFFIILIASFLIMKASNHPKYDGLSFNVIQEGQLTFYQTSFPIMYQGKITDYNIYLRNNPNDLKKEVPFDGKIEKIDNTVINITKEFDCNGDQVIAIGNLVNLYGAINKDIMRDDNASCDEQGRYMYLVVQPGEKTSIEKFGPNCYNINIKDCEILEGTERFIAEMLVKINSEIK